MRERSWDTRLSQARGLGRSAVSDLATRKNMALLAAAGVVGLLGLMGGFGAAEPVGVAQLDAAQLAGRPEIDADPLTVWLGAISEKDGARVVEATLLNKDSQSMAALDLNQVFRIENSARDDGEEQPTIFPEITRRISGGSESDFGKVGLPVILGPGVPVDVTITFPDLDGTGAPLEADTLVITGQEYRESFLDGSDGWFSTDRMAEVSLR
ncbi:hypothetical protein [uncultured Corynebacterium sp.]|uniref:hypothetical protein n=1 Tax=uncultured Corynebacterium sp. TaxID=159447 RepID=UPI0025FF68AA|nr:hypothetical protein [uncultured Corynebacterium sp.]